MGLPRPATRRPLVPLRATLARSTRRRRSAEGRPRSHPRSVPGLLRPRRPKSARHRRVTHHPFSSASQLTVSCAFISEAVPKSHYPQNSWPGVSVSKVYSMDVHEHRLLTALLRRERQGMDTHFVYLMELEGYLGQIGDLQTRGVITVNKNKPNGVVIELTSLG